MFLFVQRPVKPLNHQSNRHALPKGGLGDEVQPSVEIILARVR